MSKTLQRRDMASIRIPRQSQRRVGAPVLLGSKDARGSMSFEHISKKKRISCVAPSTRCTVQFLAALYIHALALVILVVFSRNVLSTTIRTTLLPLLR